MNDFLVQFAPRVPTQRLSALLRDRPGVSAHPVSTFEFPWGTVAIQPPAARGYAPMHEGGTLTAAVGRPHFVGVDHESRGESGFNALLRERLAAGDPGAVSAALTGMFATIECGPAGVRVLTDQMAFMPVYVGHDAAGRVAAIGTHLDSVAALAGRAADFDPVSLGDLLVNQYVTFPYTTRRGVTQLEPASLTEFAVDAAGEVRAADVRTTILWQPMEPEGGRWPSPKELEDELEAALLAAADDVSRGASRLGLTLSGGLDSRLVLALLRGKVTGAITYATRENRELEVARKVAAAAGIAHHVAWRGEEFYAELMPRAVALLGTELRGECHGFAIPDNRLDQHFDLVVGGFLSDTLFKGHYLSRATKERLRPKTAYAAARQTAARAARAIGVLPPPKVRPHYFDVARAMAARLRPEVRDAVAGRQRVRLEQVRRVRPQTHEEWLRFWPTSRADGSYGPQANTRLFTADELFMHRRLIEVAARVPAAEKLDGALTKRVFPRMYGDLGQIENASTGVPAADAYAASRRRRHTDVRPDGAAGGNGAANGTPARSPYPWNDVEHSWVNYELLQKHSPTWSSYRTALARSPALDVLDGVLDGGVRDFVDAYRDEAGFLFNRAAVQLTYALDRTLRTENSRP